MAKSCGELCKNWHFILKIIALICGLMEYILNAVTNNLAHSYEEVSRGYKLSFTIVIAAFLILYILNDYTKVTEICLLSACLTKIIMSTVYIGEASRSGWYNHGLINPDEPLPTQAPFMEKNEGYLIMAFNIVAAILVLVDILIWIFKG